MSSVKKLCITAVCVALCCVLPTAFHSVGLGTVLSPLHIPVLLCGLICGWPYGLVCGILGPCLSSVITGMPGAPMLLSMVPELMSYGLFTGLMMRLLKLRSIWAKLYISLGTAMVLGRVVGGIAKALVFMGSGQTFTLSLWATGYFVSTAPGIVCHLVLIPLLYMALVRARQIPAKVA
jgi:hypothetical protein